MSMGSHKTNEGVTAGWGHPGKLQLLDCFNDIIRKIPCKNGHRLQDTSPDLAPPLLLPYPETYGAVGRIITFFTGGKGINTRSMVCDYLSFFVYGFLNFC